MKKFRSLLAVAAVLAIVFVSCSKTGDTGPAGPAGAAGATGAAGPDSVVYSPWIPLAFTLNTTDNQYEDTLITPSITQSILDNGIILTYVNFQEQDGTYHVVAVSSLSYEADGVYTILEDYSLGQINIISNADLSGLPYRYVTIPGSMVTGNGVSKQVKGFTAAQLKAMSFEKVQQVLTSSKN